MLKAVLRQELSRWPAGLRHLMAIHHRRTRCPIHKIPAAAFQQLLPKQPSIAIGAQPIRVKVSPTDTGGTSVVMVKDPTKDG